MIHRPSCSKLMMWLVTETLNFQTYRTSKHCHFLLKKIMRSFCTAKALNNFFEKNITTIDLVSTVRLNKFLTNDLVKLMLLRTTGPTSFEMPEKD